jgi:hypothetical protein
MRGRIRFGVPEEVRHDRVADRTRGDEGSHLGARTDGFGRNLLHTAQRVAGQGGAEQKEREPDLTHDPASTLRYELGWRPSQTDCKFPTHHHRSDTRDSILRLVVIGVVGWLFIVFFGEPDEVFTDGEITTAPPMWTAPAHCPIDPPLAGSDA